MYSAVLRHVRTKEDAISLANEIDLLIEALYGQDGKFEEILGSSVKNWFAGEIKQVFQDVSIDKAKYLKDLKVKLSSLKELKLTVALEPTETGLDRIHSWIIENIGEEVVLDISKNPAILGGAVVIYKGNYRNYSLRKKLEDYFIKSKGEIQQILS